MSNAADPSSFTVLIHRFIEARRAQHYAEAGLRTARYDILRFASWCDGRGIGQPAEVSRPILEAYQRWLFHYRKQNGKPLHLETQLSRLVAVRSFYKWLVKQGILLHNPSSELDLPRLPEKLPGGVLTLEEVESVIDQASLATPSGLRDRAIMETLFSTGIRRAELVALRVMDLNLEEGTLWVRKAKGGGMRLVPIGPRAMAWLEKYLCEARPLFLSGLDEGIMFLNYRGEPISLGGLTNRISDFVRKAGICKSGSCHLFRHTMATLMLEGGADIRYIQAILGHRRLSTTQVYTKVSIKQLKIVHERTHPGAKLSPDIDRKA